MSNIEEIIEKIKDTDDVEIMEFDFDPCFKLMRDMEAALLSFKTQYSLSPWIIKKVDDALGL